MGQFTYECFYEWFTFLLLKHFSSIQLIMFAALNPDALKLQPAVMSLLWVSTTLNLITDVENCETGVEIVTNEMDADKNVLFREKYSGWYSHIVPHKHNLKWK